MHSLGKSGNIFFQQVSHEKTNLDQSNDVSPPPSIHYTIHSVVGTAYHCCVKMYVLYCTMYYVHFVFIVCVVLYILLLNKLNCILHIVILHILYCTHCFVICTYVL